MKVYGNYFSADMYKTELLIYSQSLSADAMQKRSAIHLFFGFVIFLGPYF